jgi:hypothetical protein
MWARWEKIFFAGKTAAWTSASVISSGARASSTPPSWPRWEVSNPACTSGAMSLRTSEGLAASPPASSFEDSITRPLRCASARLSISCNAVENRTSTTRPR